MAVMDRLFKTSDTWPSIPRFLTVGALSTLVDVGLFAVLHEQVGLPVLIANTLSYSTGIVISYVLHRRWTFRQRTRRGVGMQFSQFALISLNALLLNNLSLLWLSHPLGVLAAHPEDGDLLAKLCATGVGVCWNFLANNFWTFRSSPT